MKVLVTGAAGFIGMHTCERLLARGDEVLGVDNLNDYYDPSLKAARLAQLGRHANFQFERIDLADREATAALFANGRCRRVIHLAAQAGVRYSLTNPHAYASSNLAAFVNVLEGCRHHGVEHLVYASSSSVYGGNTKMPFAESDPVDHPVSLYAATKKANELMAHTYSHLYRLPTTGLRFFTVYGPWGRPDMAYFSFSKAILEGRPIDVFNHGQMSRDFTYIDDIAEGVVRVVDRVPEPPPAGGGVGHDAPSRVFNIGNSAPVPLLEFISTLERCLGRKAQLRLLPMQDGDVPATYADVEALAQWVGFRPTTPIDVGLERFAAWFRAYYPALG
ncbi:NAD-dependent epimerase [Piscinibacter sp. XHJ-5]|uniref:NAD-dependent epimerase n=1 Tax=Piscinibacter sp. XHJ-5 TaxID=3037797 RepID=UPI00245359F6|nr:NAD-dependent epimerase [Piscinibacter sp. XHJ-5]